MYSPRKQTSVRLGFVTMMIRDTLVQKAYRGWPEAPEPQAALGNLIPLASNALKSADSCAAVSFRCGGRIFSQRGSLVLRATNDFKAGISGTEITALRVAERTS